MARSITEIQEAIREKVSASVPVRLSSSKTSEWSLWTYVVAVAIHAFELVLDLFRKEMETLTSEATPGTLRWYAEMCRRFQYGDELVYNPDTGMLSYPQTDESKRIIAAVAVSEAATEEGAMAIFVKVAKQEGGKLVELDEAEKRALVNYLDAIRFVGCQVETISSNADSICYDLTVYHDPLIPEGTVRAEVEEALTAFKTTIDFDGVLYRQRLLDAVMEVDGVVTCKLDGLLRHSYQTDGWVIVETHSTLDAGYFEFAEEEVEGKKCVLNVVSVNELLKNA